MGPNSMFPSVYPSYVFYGCSLCGLNGSFCCGMADYCGHTGNWVWPLTWLAARLCLVFGCEPTREQVCFSCDWWHGLKQGSKPAASPFMVGASSL